MATQTNTRRSSSGNRRSSASTRRRSTASGRTTAQRSASAKKAAATRQRKTAGTSARRTRSSARTTARSATRTAAQTAQAQATGLEFVAKQAERVVLIPVGATLTARDNVVDTVKPFVKRTTARREVEKLQRRVNTNLRKFERRGNTA